MIDYRINNVPTDVNACVCTGGCMDTVGVGTESWLGEKSLAARGSQTCLSGVPVWRSTNWATSPPLGYVSRSGLTVHWTIAPQMHWIPTVHSISELIFHVLPLVIMPAHLVSMERNTSELFSDNTCFCVCSVKTNYDSPTLHSFSLKMIIWCLN